VKDLTTEWVLKDAREITAWDKRIEVTDQLPVLKNFPQILRGVLKLRGG